MIFYRRDAEISMGFAEKNTNLRGSLRFLRASAVKLAAGFNNRQLGFIKIIILNLESIYSPCECPAWLKPELAVFFPAQIQPRRTVCPFRKSAELNKPNKFSGSETL